MSREPSSPPKELFELAAKEGKKWADSEGRLARAGRGYQAALQEADRVVWAAFRVMKTGGREPSARQIEQVRKAIRKRLDDIDKQRQQAPWLGPVAGEEVANADWS
jgi:hypothetical protein